MRESQASAKAYKDFLEHINLLGGIVVEACLSRAMGDRFRG